MRTFRPPPADLLPLRPAELDLTCRTHASRLRSRRQAERPPHTDRPPLETNSVSRTILLVEDHEDNRIVYRTILEHVGYTVLLAADGAEGVRLARERLPDLVLMDVSIPVMDGWEATATLKADPATAAIPI